MLYLEEGQTLNLLPGVPRNWLEDGKKISLSKVQSYFGPLSLDVTSHVNKGLIEANITCNSTSKPQDVRIRIPHPAGKKAIRVNGGTYDSKTESVLIQGFQGTATVKLEY